MKLPDEIRKIFAEYGKKGGERTKELYGLKHLSEAGRKGNRARQRRQKKLDAAIHSRGVDGEW